MTEIPVIFTICVSFLDTIRSAAILLRGIRAPNEMLASPPMDGKTHSESESGSPSWWSLFELMPDAATITSAADGRMLVANQAAAQMYGWALEELLGRTTLELGLFQSEEGRAAMIALIRAHGMYRDHEAEYWRRGSEHRIGMFSAKLIDYEGQPCILVIGRDITGIRHQEQALRESEARYRMLAEATQDIPWELDLDGRVTYVGPGIARLGYLPVELHGVSVFEMVHPDDIEVAKQPLIIRRRTGREKRYFRIRLRDRNGSYHVYENNAAPVRDHSGRLVGVHGLARDVREHVEHEQRLIELAHRDSLTGLLNRQGFFTELEMALQRLDGPGEGVAFLFVDLDDFKQVNDSAGHAEGDRCLWAVARALQGVLRGSDRAARIGGDEFAVLLTPIEQADALSVAERILSLFEELATCRDDCEALITASIGVYIAHPGDDADELLTNADEAMYAAKAKGKNRVEVFERRLNRD